MYNGVVKFFNEKSGYGFITGNDGKDVFVHVSGLLDKNANYMPGKQCTFDLKDGKKGKEAYNVDLN